MPRFYFHVGDGDSFAEDEEGQELPDVETARHVAITGARGIMAEQLRCGELDLASFIEVEDHTRKLLFTLSFADVVRINRRT